MNARHLHPPARKSTAAVRRDPGAATPAAPPADIPGRAGCCPAKAAGASVREQPGTSPDVAAWIREAA